MKLIIFLLLSSCLSTTPVQENTEVVVEVPEQVKGDLFTVRSSLPLVHEILPVANCMENNEAFKAKVDPEIWKRMTAKRPIVLTTYSKRAFWGTSPVYAYTYLNHDEIYINTRYYRRSMPSLINTVFHELTHTAGYAHGKDDPIPWDIGRVAEIFAKECMK